MTGFRHHAWRSLALCAALMVAAPAKAQFPFGPTTTAPSLNTTAPLDLTAPRYLTDGTLSTGRQVDERLRLRLEVGTTFFAYENADFRKRSIENIEDEIRYSDDRSFFVETRVAGGFGYSVHPDVSVDIGFLHRGLWGARGNDSGTDSLSQQYLGYLGAFNQLSITYKPRLGQDWDFAMVFGRHYFAIGDVPTDYMLDDTVDGVSIRLGRGMFGTVRGLVDLFTASTLSDQSLRELQLDTTLPDRYFRGQVNTLRVGGLYENVNRLVPGLTFKAYYFYADIGASDARGTGADVSYSGTLGNFADNDYTYMLGSRGSYEVKLLENKLTRMTLMPYAEVARSGGIDRKEAVARDVATTGNAFGGGLQWRQTHGRSSFLASSSFYHFDGASHASDGLQFKSGFVSMNAQPVGALAAARVLGYRPSASVDATGIRYTPNNKTRYAGTEVLQATLAAAYEKSRITFKYYNFRDTGKTFLDFSRLPTIDPPFGYSRNQFEAEKRLGKSLGQEFYLSLSHLVNDHMRVGVEGGIFLPGKFYKIRIAEVAGDELGGNALFWVLSGGVSAWL